MIKDAYKKTSQSSIRRGPDRLLGWMSSLADPTRLRLLHVLDSHELGVAELCEVLKLPQSTVSRHLKVLTDQGWTRHRRKGTAHLYQSRVEDVDPAASELLNVARRQVEHWPTLSQDRLRLMKALRRREQDPRSFFADAASDWDRIRAELYGRGYLSTALMALLPSNWTIADLGCGTGTTLAALSPVAGRVIGVDQSPQMLDAAKRRTKDLANIEIRRGLVEKAPIEDASCDAALLILVLSYLDDPQAGVAEAARIVKPGGRIVMVDLFRHDREDFRVEVGQRWPGFEEKQFKGWLTDAGVDRVRVQPLEPDPEALAPALLLATGDKRGNA